MHVQPSYFDDRFPREPQKGTPLDTVVTGAAGFIGSHVAEGLLRRGHRVVGVDSLTPYYDPERKRANLRILQAHPNFEWLGLDLRTADLLPVVRRAAAVFHLAAQPGVRGSWSTGFDVYARHNILATQRLLEAARETRLRRLVYASSSSVYGNAVSYPCHESDPVQPYSPYGVTKMAGEHLCRAYAENFGLPTVSLRYFTVFGPRQRPEMAASRLIESALTGRPFPLYGDGTAVRDFTYVEDIAEATIVAGLESVPPGTVLNVGGGSPVNVAQLIDLVSETVGTPVPVDRQPASPGDVRRTGGATEGARSLLGWEPRTTLERGIQEQVTAQARQLATAA